MGSGEEPLLRRFCRGAGCGAVFWICRHCDRGHQYYGERCRRKARRQRQPRKSHLQWARVAVVQDIHTELVWVLPDSKVTAPSIRE